MAVRSATQRYVLRMRFGTYVLNSCAVFQSKLVRPHTRSYAYTIEPNYPRFLLLFSEFLGHRLTPTRRFSVPTSFTQPVPSHATWKPE